MSVFTEGEYRIMVRQLQRMCLQAYYMQLLAMFAINYYCNSVNHNWLRKAQLTYLSVSLAC